MIDKKMSDESISCHDRYFRETDHWFCHHIWFVNGLLPPDRLFRRSNLAMLNTHARIALIREVNIHPAGTLVRVLGKLISASGVAGSIVLEHEGSTVDVSTALLNSSLPTLEIGSLYQVVGEIKNEKDRIVIQAKVVRKVDGIDVLLFVNAAKLLREWSGSHL